MDILTILNTLLLPPFLFLLYFSIGALLLNAMRENAPSDQQPEHFMKQYADAFADDPPFEIDEIPTNHSKQEPPVENTPSETLITNTPSSLQQEEMVLDTPKSYDLLTNFIKKLKQPQLRKLCRPLGIQQKRNGVWLSTDLMRAEVQRNLKQNPTKVWQACQERIPKCVPHELYSMLA